MHRPLTLKRVGRFDAWLILFTTNSKCPHDHKNWDSHEVFYQLQLACADEATDVSKQQISRRTSELKGFSREEIVQNYSVDAQIESSLWKASLKNT